MRVYILYHKAWCLPGGGGKVGLTHVVKWCAKKCAYLSVTSVDTTSTNIGVMVVLHVHHEFKHILRYNPPPRHLY